MIKIHPPLRARYKLVVNRICKVEQYIFSIAKLNKLNDFAEGNNFFR